ncbi:DUF4342 domain-containing protein [Umezawaea endophytica]|uniref:DUF4342 domain-containing protein n=1 Tax=Umezawaea endophytica TaxID=1654476 RepID=A0A9X2VNH1_9PSEU|nr:DUF4342 domain-containing protein [Umezawaea endophytica]MCS7479364.1 DUF4342 domain-containing protein [Umezawaea endophytica]
MATRESTVGGPVEHDVHHVVVKDHDGYPVVEVSMPPGVLAAVVTPLVAAAGAVAALAVDWTVEVD